MPTLRLKIQYNKNVGAIMSPTELRENYLFGIPMCSPDGTKLSSSAILQYILSAQTLVENMFSLKFIKQVIEENRDFVRQEFMSFDCKYRKFSSFVYYSMKKNIQII